MNIQPHSPQPAAAAVLRGMVFALIAFGLLAALNVFAKLLSDTHTPVENVFYRCIGGLVLTVAFLTVTGRLGRLKTSNLRGQIGRGALGLLSNILIFATFAHLPLADGTVLLFAASILMPVFGFFFLSEKVGVWRWSAIAAGFCGIALMAGPTGSGSPIGLIFGLGAATTIALSAVMMRWLGRSDDPFATAFYFQLIAACGAGLCMPFIANPLTGEDLLYIAGLGITGGGGALLLASAYKLAPPSAVAPLNYTGLLWATLFDILLWAYIPGWPIYLGGGIVIASGLVIVYRERRNQTA